jgi:hypothetical protein
MKLPRRRFLHLAAGGAALPAVSRVAWAQMPAQSREILQIDYQNPQFNRTDDWAKAIAGHQFPLADYEWTQVLAPSEDYDQFGLVGATGWMINPHHSHGDFPFTHPFLDASSDPTPPDLPPVFDWEFHFALDRDPNNPRMDYQFLLAAGNREAVVPAYGNESELNNLKDAINLGLDVPNGLLGVEIDGGLVPAGFKTGVKTGDRIAVFGRWIVDTAHPYGPQETFRSEIHPPLLMACARVQPLASGQPGTRVLFTSRPYLVGQRYTLDTDKAYDDSAADDGPTLTHFAKEFAKASTPIAPLSLQIEAHPKIKSHPFRGSHLLHIKVRPPPPEGRPVGGLRPHLAVSFQFTVRTGCAVQVTSSSSDTVDVFISLSHGNYTPPPLPRRRPKNWTREQFDKMARGIGLPLLGLEAGSSVLEALLGLAPIDAARVSLILERGIKSGLYDFLPGVAINDAQHAVTRARPNEVSPGAGIVQNNDNDQPFPIFGWLEATWQLSGPPL